VGGALSLAINSYNNIPPGVLSLVALMPVSTFRIIESISVLCRYKYRNKFWHIKIKSYICAVMRNCWSYSSFLLLPPGRVEWLYLYSFCSPAHTAGVFILLR